MDSYFEMLKNTPIFKDANDETLNFVLKSGETVKFKKGDIIYSKKNYRKSLSVILEGRVTVKKTQGQKEVIINTLLSGDMFGAAAVFNNSESFIGTVSVAEKSAVLFIDQKLLSELFRLDMRIAENYISFLSSALTFLNKKIDDLLLQGTEKKVLSYLRSQAELKGEDCVVPSYSMTKLARFLNIGRASLYRAFASLEEKGFIEKQGKAIIVFCENDKSSQNEL